MSGFGKWTTWYEASDKSWAFGDTASYQMGANFLSDCISVEDWGCGRGWFRRFRPDNCIGLDGSHSPFADKIVDLTEYTSSVDGIFMRHVLEHNYNWKKILRNAIASFKDKMVLVIFTPWSAGETTQIRMIERVGVPDLALSKPTVLMMLEGLHWEFVELKSPDTIYGHEYVFLIERNPP